MEVNKEINKLRLSWHIGSTSGQAEIIMNEYFPCNQRMFKKLLQFIIMCDDELEILEHLETYLDWMVTDLQMCREPALLKQREQLSKEHAQVCELLGKIRNL